MAANNLHDFEVSLFALSMKQELDFITINADVPATQETPIPISNRSIVTQDISLPESSQQAQQAIFTSADTIVRVLQQHGFVGET